MAKINLKSNDVLNRRPKSQGSNKSLLFGIIVLVLGLAAFGTIRYLTIETGGKIEEALIDIQNLEAKVSTDEFKDLYDFQDRLIEIEKVMSGRIRQGDILDKVQANTLPTTRFLKFHDEKKVSGVEVTATMVVISHNEIAKQIEAYSLIDGVSRVLLNSSRVNKEGDGVETEITFELEDVK